VERPDTNSHPALNQGKGIIMSDRKPIEEFGVMKWLFMVALTATLCTITSYFNLRIFGAEDGLPYVFAVTCIGAGTLANARYLSSKNRGMRYAAYIFEVLLSIVLIVSAAYAMSGLRELSLARQVNQSQNEAIKDIKDLKSRSAQKAGMEMVAAKYSKSQDVQAIFTKYDKPLFYLLIIELSAFGLSIFTMMGIAFLPDRDGDGVPDIFQSKKEGEVFDAVDSAENFNGEAIRPKGQR